MATLDQATIEKLAEHVENAVLWALAKDRNDRPATAADLAEAMAG